MDPESVPLQISCLGCKRYFLIDEKLPLQSMTVQFKNYSFPIKESFLKDNILRTIVGFLNSKGGTIFMGVNDSNGSVNGVYLDRKQMDEFKLMIKQMLQKIQPSVDLIKSEEVSVDFVPVLEGKERSFYGKYIIKFIVLQGDPSKLYCLSERVKVSSSKMEDVEAISAFRRHNFGGVQEIKGIKVIHQIYQKARNPHRIANTFHLNCNPPPLCPVIAVRQRSQKPQRIFADEEIEKRVSSSSNSQNQNSEKQTLINIIKNVQNQRDEQKRFSIKREEPIYLFFKNLRSDSIKSFMNFIRNSTVAKTSLQICSLNEIVRVRFSSESERQCMIEQLSKSSMKRLIDGFGNNEKVQFTQSYEVLNKDSQNSDKTQKNQQKVYLLIFHGYDSGTQPSIQNYLQKCLTSNIERKMKKTKQGLEFEFKSRKDMFVFESMCKKPPHSNQLDRFWSKGKALIKTSSRGEIQKRTKENQNEFKDIVKMEEEVFPSLLSSPIKSQLVHKQSRNLELIASSLDPSQVSKLCNYLTNNMFYNIQKKLLLSKDKYYLRIVFNQTQDCRKFLQYCNTEQHKNLLAQFANSKVLRIGVPGESLLIFPYTEHLKDQIKKMVLKVLGQGVIKTSAVKPYNNEAKVWSLSLVDNSKLLDSYQKLENYLRKSPLFFNQEWTLFKVYLDYKELKQ